jgi:hypothetical protein
MLVGSPSLKIDIPLAVLELDIVGDECHIGADSSEDLQKVAVEECCLREADNTVRLVLSHVADPVDRPGKIGGRILIAMAENASEDDHVAITNDAVLVMSTLNNPVSGEDKRVHMDIEESRGERQPLVLRVSHRDSVENVMAGVDESGEIMLPDVVEDGCVTVSRVHRVLIVDSDDRVLGREFRSLMRKLISVMNQDG